MRGASRGGIVAVKVDLDPIEAEWRVDENHILVTDPGGMVIVSTDPAWLYRALGPVTADDAAQQEGADSPPAMMADPEPLENGTQIVWMSGGDGAARRIHHGKSVDAADRLEGPCALDTSYVRQQAQLLLAAGLLVLGAGVSVAAILLQRRARLAERMGLQDAAQAELERRVDERTADLAPVNARSKRKSPSGGHRTGAAPDAGRSGAGRQARGARPDVGGL